MPTKEEYQQHPEKYKTKARAAYALNKDKIAARRQLPEVKARRLVSSKKYRETNKEKISQRMREYYWRDGGAVKQRYKIRGQRRHKEGMGFLNEIKLQYGCCNPICKWRSDFKPYQLDFHHLNPDDKLFNVMQYRNVSRARIIAEVNKCTVVCANCHRDITHGNLDADTFKRCAI